MKARKGSGQGGEVEFILYTGHFPKMYLNPKLLRKPKVLAPPPPQKKCYHFPIFKIVPELIQKNVSIER